MRFFRGLFSLLNFDAYVLGIGMLIVSKLVDESSLLLFGIIALIVGIVGSVLFTLKTPKGFKAKVAFYYFINGALVFLNFLIIGIPFTRMILNMMRTQGSGFIDWKDGFMEYDETGDLADNAETDDKF